MIEEYITYPATQYTPKGGNKTVKITKRRVEIISSTTSTSTSEEFRLELLRAMLVVFLWDGLRRAREGFLRGGFSWFGGEVWRELV